MAERLALLCQKSLLLLLLFCGELLGLGRDLRGGVEGDLVGWVDALLRLLVPETSKLGLSSQRPSSPQCHNQVSITLFGSTHAETPRLHFCDTHWGMASQQATLRAIHHESAAPGLRSLAAAHRKKTKLVVGMVTS